MEVKTFYQITVDHSTLLVTESKEDAYALFERLTQAGIKELKEVYRSYGKDYVNFTWLENPKVELKVKTVDVYEGKDLAEKAEASFNKAERMGLIKKQKKKI